MCSISASGEATASALSVSENTSYLGLIWYSNLEKKKYINTLIEKYTRKVMHELFDNYMQ